MFNRVLLYSSFLLLKRLNDTRRRESLIQEERSGNNETRSTAEQSPYPFPLRPICIN